jgi:hypothetical protein
MFDVHDIGFSLHLSLTEDNDIRVLGVQVSFQTLFLASIDAADIPTHRERGVKRSNPPGANAASKFGDEARRSL